MGELSLLDLFLIADPFVKAIMVMLALASIWSWSVIVDKQLTFGRIAKETKTFEQSFWGGRSLDELANAVGDRPSDGMSKVFAAAMREWRDARGRNRETGFATLGERIDRVMGIVVARETQKAEQGLGILASIGSASPFIGLLGTVWGIMNSFRALAATDGQTPSLSVVAPGLAEALFATALGLFAAIPAVIFYNKFAADANKHAASLEGFADELSAILARRIGEKG